MPVAEGSLRHRVATRAKWWPALLAVDGVGAGVNETVLVVVEGRAAGEILGRKIAPVDAAIVGIVDRIDLDERGSS